MRRYRDATGSLPATTSRPASKTEKIQTSPHNPINHTPPIRSPVTPPAEGISNVAFMSESPAQQAAATAGSIGYVEILPDLQTEDLPPPDYDFPDPPPPMSRTPSTQPYTSAIGMVLSSHQTLLAFL